MRRISPFYGVMFPVRMLVIYVPVLSLWLPRLALR
jgi:TRAP-type C4-dicarboxylate transport system permease large subunit